MDKVLTRRVLLGVTGGIAAYKVAELARLLMRNNVDVRVAMTDAATKFVTPATFQALTGKPVVTDLWDASFENNMAHIELSRHADAIVYAVRLDRGLSPPDVLQTKPGERWDEENGLNELQYIVPGGGGFGELMNNAYV